MSEFATIQHAALQYYGVDWLVMLTAFACLFYLGEKNRTGFLVGMVSASAGLVFSYQIGSIANGISSMVVLFLYLRGYLRW